VTISPAAGTTVTGPMRDGGDGTYRVEVTWDPATTPQPELVLTQPDRAPVCVHPAGARPGCPRLLCLLLAVALVVVVLMLLVVLVRS
jgi:hypothetical protein